MFSRKLQYPEPDPPVTSIQFVLGLDKEIRNLTRFRNSIAASLDRPPLTVTLQNASQLRGRRRSKKDRKVA
jgi:hypothetical protein